MGKSTVRSQYPITPDGRYFVVKERLWRRSDPAISEPKRQRLVDVLMHARREISGALRRKDAEAETKARAEVHAAKVALGERGPVWWNEADGDYNRHLVKKHALR